MIDGTNNKTLTVQIMGKEYQVGCPAGEEDSLRKAASLLDEKMRAIRNTGSIIGLERIAIMVALNLSHELLSHPPQSTQEGSSERIEALLSLVNTELSKAI